MVVQHRFPLLLRKLDPETSISTPVPTASFIAVRIIHIPGISIHMPGILIHILPESLFTSPRNRYSHAPEYAGNNYPYYGTQNSGIPKPGRGYPGKLTMKVGYTGPKPASAYMIDTPNTAEAS